jgi:hypothetical protein
MKPRTHSLFPYVSACFVGLTLGITYMLLVCAALP